MKQELVIPGITNVSTLACVARARKYSQYKKMVADALANRCPFCDIDRKHNKVIAETDFWYAWPCNPPEKNTGLHFLFVPKRHVMDTEELSAKEWVGLAEIRRIVRDMYDYPSCGVLICDGDATLSAGTIQHLHVHEMVPDGTGRVESPFYKGTESEEEGLRRAIVFEKLRTGSFPFLLSPEEKELVKNRLE